MSPEKGPFPKDNSLPTIILNTLNVLDQIGFHAHFNVICATFSHCDLESAYEFSSTVSNLNMRVGLGYFEKIPLAVPIKPISSQKANLAGPQSMP